MVLTDLCFMLIPPWCFFLNGGRAIMLRKTSVANTSTTTSGIYSVSTFTLPHVPGKSSRFLAIFGTLFNLSHRHTGIPPTLSGRLRAGSQRGSGCFPLHFRHFPLDYLFGAWYNKVVIPQTLHQQHRERAESCHISSLYICLS